MTLHLNVIEADLTPEQCAELDAVKGDKEKTEAILRRIADEVMAKRGVDSVVEAVEDIADKLRMRLLDDVLLSVHFLMHRERIEEAKELLCPVAAMLEGVKPPMDVMEALLRKLDAVNLEREPAEGHA